MDQAISTAAAAVPEDTRIARQFGPIEFIRRLREDELSILVPEVFSRNLLHQRLLFLDSFFINQPDYIEHVLLANHRNYRKSHFQRNILGPLLGEGLLLSEGAFWQRQRRIAAPAFHHRRIADFVAAMTSCTATAIARWRGRSEAFRRHARDDGADARHHRPHHVLERCCRRGRHRAAPHGCGDRTQAEPARPAGAPRLGPARSGASLSSGRRGIRCHGGAAAGRAAARPLPIAATFSRCYWRRASPRPARA